MRDVVVHGYFGIEPRIIWNVVINDLPTLKIQIEKMMK
jgi:uncharacterized protein with HEPN domain